ncbi:unnamed protein product [Discula destructiva]
MSNSKQAENLKSGRSGTSCLECQRRKQKCSREWPCNHCQARKVPHLCQFASPKKAGAGGSDLCGGAANSAKVSGKRKASSFQPDSFAVAAPDPDQGLSDGLAQLGYMIGHDFFNLAKPGIAFSNDRGPEVVHVQSDEIETALKVVLSKPYTDILVQNFLDNANYHYYAIFPGQLRDQSAQWWESRAARRRLSPELTCLLIRVCAVSTQYLEDSLRQRLELELGEKAQSMTERFHAAAQRLSSTIPRGSGGVLQVQQLFQEASWWESEANMIEAWHSLSVAIREAQEIGMHKHTDDLPNFEQEIRKRLWCILWTWDWQMSTLLSRPLLIDQDDYTLEIPDGRLENIIEPGAPHPLSSIALQASLGLSVSHLFQKLSTDSSVQLVQEIEAALEQWMGTFPAALRDDRPDTRWDQTYPSIPFMRCQVNVIACCYLLAPLKPYLLGTADLAVPQMQTQTQRHTPLTTTTDAAADLRHRAVDACLALIAAAARFHALIFPASIKYFYIVFFLFDAATVLCSALMHDGAADALHMLPKRGECVRALRTAQDLMEAVAHLSESARISALLLRKLVATLPLTIAEKQVLVGGAPFLGWKGKGKLQSRPSSEASRFGITTAVNSASATAHTDGFPGVVGPPADGVVSQARMMPMEAGYQPRIWGNVPDMEASTWNYVDYSGAVGENGGYVGTSTEPSSSGIGMIQPGDPLKGTYLDQLWNWDRLNMDLGQAGFR